MSSEVGHAHADLVVMLLHNLAPKLSYLRLVNVTPWPLLFLSANPVINAFSCVERIVLNLSYAALAVVHLHTHDVQYVGNIFSLELLCHEIRHVELATNLNCSQIKGEFFQFRLETRFPMLQKSPYKRHPSAQC